MMNKLGILAIVLGSVACGAKNETSNTKGTSNQDPVTLHYRLLFSQSRTPTLADLKEGKIWTCYFRKAYKDDFTEGRGLTYVFQKQGDLVGNFGSSSVKTFVTAAEGLTGNTGDYMLVTRATSEGTLVGEWSTSPGLFPRLYSEAALANTSRRAFAYELCQPQN